MQRLNSSYRRIALARNLFAIAILTTAFVSIDHARAIAAAADAGDESAAVNKLFEQWNTPSSPGCAVAVMKDGRIVYEHGYGMADLNHDIKVTPATIFDVGSIAKQFTATAILLLAQEGKLSLNDSIRKYVPEVPDFGVPITLQQMLHHTSGLRDYEQLLWFNGWRLDSPDLLTDGDILGIVSRQKELNFSPGSDFDYSNTNYMLLAQVVSHVSGESFEQFTKARVFEPLGMAHTHFRSDHGEIVENLADSYEKGDDGAFHLSLPNYDTVGATDLLTTVEDLAHWDENFYTAKVGGQQLVNSLQEPGQLNDGTRLAYAEGLFVSPPGGLKIAETGDAGDAGYSANVSRFPDYHLSVATLCNNRPIDSNDLSHRVADVYMGGKFSAFLAALAVPGASVQLDPHQLATDTGTFIDRDKNLILQIEQRGDVLRAHWFWGPSSIDSELEALSEKRFRFPNVGEIDFGDDGNVRMIEKSTGARLRPRSVPYTRVPQIKANAADLREFAGEYSSEEMYVPYYVTLASDGLVLHPPKMLPSTLSPLAKDVFFCDGIRLRFTRDTKGDVSGFLMSGRWNRVQNVKFERAAHR
jgi:CubicO group peptidase (beta-lactamase class C family)